MITRMFQKTVINITHNNGILIKYFHHCNNVSFRNVQETVFLKNTALVYSSNERNVPKRQNISAHQQMHTNIFKGPLLCNATPVLSSTIPVNQRFTVNNIRQYSSSSPEILNQTAVYSNGVWQFFSESLPVEYLTQALKILQSETGLPWWATIILTTIMLRVFINLPLTIHDHQVRARIQNIQSELNETAKKLQMEARMGMATSGWTASYANAAVRRALAEERTQLYQIHNCHPLKSAAIIMLQAPIWISLSVALSNMCYMLPYRNNAAYQTYLQFTTGGFGWIKDLTVTDPCFVLPILFGLSGLTVIEINQLLFRVKNESKFTKYMTYFLRAVIIFFVYIMAYMPSSLALYWTTNNYCTLLQSLLLLSPKIRRLGRIPKTQSEYPHPYSELYKKLKDKVVLKLK
nr:PREDICTED: mitochondrial inner membrane protein COX18 [Megachile rotundata]